MAGGSSRLPLRLTFTLLECAVLFPHVQKSEQDCSHHMHRPVQSLDFRRVRRFVCVTYIPQDVPAVPGTPAPKYDSMRDPNPSTGWAIQDDMLKNEFPHTSAPSKRIQDFHFVFQDLTVVPHTC